MSTHFVTFLGRAATAPAGRGPLDAEPSRYRFPDGACSEPTSLFARAALANLRADGCGPDRLLVLGTAGSMWDALAELIAWAERCAATWSAAGLGA